MGAKLIDLIGQRFGKLIVINRTKREEYVGNISYWDCICDCGNKLKVRSDHLRKCKKISCGCGHFIDLAGQKFGRLTVKQKTKRPDGINKKRTEAWFTCECDCGNIIVVSSESLKCGSTKSCGCFQKDSLKERLGIEYSLASFNVLFSQYKRGAKRRNLPFCLNKEEFREIIGKRCFYCNCNPSQIMCPNAINGSYVYNGIDRIDSSKGYTIDNAVPCCKVCNYAKKTTPQSEFLQWIERVYTHSILGKKEVENSNE